MSCLREVQTISKSPDILPLPSLRRFTTGGVLNPLKNTTNTGHNELLHQDPLQPPLEPRGRFESRAVCCAPSNFACNSPVTISRFELVSLELQRFWLLLKFHAIELHATFLGAGPQPAGGVVRTGNSAGA